MPSMKRLYQESFGIGPSTSSTSSSPFSPITTSNNKRKVSSTSTSSPKFPSIRQLLNQKHQKEDRQKEQQKIQTKLDQIPPHIKKQYVAMDCEMVGIGSEGKKSALARVSIVDWFGKVILDKYVQVPIRVTDFRTHVSGVTPYHLQSQTGAISPNECRKIVTEAILHRIVVGHALSNDFKALFLTHPKSMIRDTAKYRPFQRYSNSKWRPRKLKDLVVEHLVRSDGDRDNRNGNKDDEGEQEGQTFLDFQRQSHDSVQDAQATMKLFQLVYYEWEKSLK